MERLAMVYRVKPEKRDEYIKAHDEAWPEILKGLKDAGCREMTIFIRGDLLFLYALIENIDQFTKTREKDPYFQKMSLQLSLDLMRYGGSRRIRFNKKNKTSNP